MKISTRGRYALRMMIELAKRQGDGYVSLTELSERLGISKKYLEQIIPLLSRASFLMTYRGHSGGYRLTRAPEEYSVGEVLRVTEGSIAPVPCVEPDNPSPCEHIPNCPTYRVWKGLRDVIVNYLDNVRLSDLLSENDVGSPGIVLGLEPEDRRSP
ncbi:MAG: RrF2 family transcriptional regulator [Thermoguttaceae bacterium]